MSNVIRFLETLGAGNALSAAEYAATVAMLDVSDAQRKALAGRDRSALNDAVGTRARMTCLLFPAEDEPRDDEKGDEPGEKPAAVRAARRPSIRE